MNRAVVFINGKLKGNKKFYSNFIKEGDFVACADGGANHTYKLNLIPDLILGDLDSLSQEKINYYYNQGVKIEKYPVQKDKTDTQLLLEKIIKLKYQQIIVFAALGNRIDHTLGNVYLLEELSSSGITIKFVTPQETIELITDEKIINDQEKKHVSLLPMTSEVTGVFLSGFKYELKDGQFKRGDTLGMSNVVTSKKAKIEIKTGKLLMILTKKSFS